MADILFKDIVSALRITHHIDLSDEVLHEKNLSLVKNAAVSIMKKLSYSDTAEHSLTLRYDGEDRDVTLEYDRYTFESLVRDTLSDLRSAVNEALSSARTGRADIVQITLTGGASCIPCLEDIFTINDTAEISYIHERVAARGAAVCADTHVQTPDAIGYDIGILNIPINSNMPVFEAIIKAGTPFAQCTAVYSSEAARPESSDGRGIYTLKLYRRKKGMEHVKTTYDPEGSAISFIGRYSAVIPSTFSQGSDRIIMEIKASKDELSVDAYHERRRNLLSKLLGISGEWERIDTVKVI